MSLIQETTPESVEEELREFLTRRFIDISAEFEQEPSYPVRKMMPYKPQIGETYYFPDPTGHNFDVAITAEGWWGLKSTGWVQIG